VQADRALYARRCRATLHYDITRAARRGGIPRAPHHCVGAWYRCFWRTCRAGSNTTVLPAYALTSFVTHAEGRHFLFNAATTRGTRGRACNKRTSQSRGGNALRAVLRGPFLRLDPELRVGGATSLLLGLGRFAVFLPVVVPRLHCPSVRTVGPFYTPSFPAPDGTPRCRDRTHTHHKRLPGRRIDHRDHQQPSRLTQPQQFNTHRKRLAAAAPAAAGTARTAHRRAYMAFRAFGQHTHTHTYHGTCTLASSHLHLLHPPDPTSPAMTNLPCAQRSGMPACRLLQPPRCHLLACLLLASSVAHLRTGGT